MFKVLWAGTMRAALAACIVASEARAEGAARVEIENFAFDPPELTVKAGDRIVFVNRDQVPHSVVGFRGGEELFRSREQIDTDESFSVVMDAPGEITLGCGLHARIRGIIIVIP